MQQSEELYAKAESEDERATAQRSADLSRKMGALGMPIEVSTTKKRTS